MNVHRENESTRFGADSEPIKFPQRGFENKRINVAVERLAQDRYGMSLFMLPERNYLPQFDELPERLKEHWRHQAWMILREVLEILGRQIEQ